LREMRLTLRLCQHKMQGYPCALKTGRSIRELGASLVFLCVNFTTETSVSHLETLHKRRLQASAKVGQWR
jgi:hypothetical protein